MLPHLRFVKFLIVSIPRDELAVLPSARHQCAVPQHAEREDAALVGALDGAAYPVRT